MADNQTLAAVQEVLLNARIAHTTGTEAQWTTANPVLLKGEIGLVDGTSPAKFKVGDGVKKWSELAWGNVTTLAQLAADATHRLVTDAQITAWNGKAEKTTATTSTNGLMSAADKTKLNGIASGANNYVHPAAHPATMITPDALHRFVTDTEKTSWSKKADVFVFDHANYLSTTTATSNAQKQIVKDIVSAANAGAKPVVFALNVGISKPNGRTIKLNGVATVLEISSAEVKCSVADFQTYKISAGVPTTIICAELLFKSDGTVSIESNEDLKVLTPETVINDLTHDSATQFPLSAAQGYALKQAIDGKQISAYSLVKATTESGFASTYHLTKDGSKVGTSINIPLDQVLKSSSIKTVTTTGAPYTGAKVGDKYIEFVFQNNSTPQYLPVQDLVDVYKGDNTYIQVSSTNVISLNYSALKTKLQNDLGSVFDAKGAGTAAAKAAIDEFKNSSFVIKCAIPGMS